MRSSLLMRKSWSLSNSQNCRNQALLSADERFYFNGFLYALISVYMNVSTWMHNAFVEQHAQFSVDDITYMHASIYVCDAWQSSDIHYTTLTISSPCSIWRKSAHSWNTWGLYWCPLLHQAMPAHAASHPCMPPTKLLTLCLMLQLCHVQKCTSTWAKSCQQCPFTKPIIQAVISQTLYDLNPECNCIIPF